MDLNSFQAHISKTYGDKDRKRGVDGTFMYLMEEIGELATALREGNQADIESEFADVLAWTSSLASLVDVDLKKSVGDKYSECQGCKKIPCECATKL